jgi:hypothetical protein
MNLDRSSREFPCCFSIGRFRIVGISFLGFPVAEHEIILRNINHHFIIVVK